MILEATLLVIGYMLGQGNKPSTSPAKLPWPQDGKPAPKPAAKPKAKDQVKAHAAEIERAMDPTAYDAAEMERAMNEGKA